MKFLSLILLSFLISCSSEIQRKEKPENLIPEDKMVVVLKDLSILEAHIKAKYPLVAQNHKTMIKSVDIIFKKHHIDSTAFNDAMDYYGTHQEIMQDINSRVLELVNRELTEISAKKQY